MRRNTEFSEQEEKFFADGEELARAEAEPVEDFSDLDPDPESGDDEESWVRRALSVLALVRS